VALSVRDEGSQHIDHDVFDEMVASWTRTQTAARVVETLQAQGIPAERVITGDQMYEIAQLDARGYYEQLEHPVTGPHRYPGWPFRITPGPQRHHRTAPPTLGQHNDEILRDLGLSAHEVTGLRQQRIIGERVLNA
jgi:crotonobetainyl-CoA:carnitine CoA-transferase CaiB-like acyl-CoA transferase